MGVWNGYDPWRRGSVLGLITVTSLPNDKKSWEPTCWGDSEPRSLQVQRLQLPLVFLP